MSIRLSFNFTNEKIKKMMGITMPFTVHPNYNIAPTHAHYVIINDQPNKVQKFKWGLIPGNAVDDRHCANFAMAMKEGIMSKTSFRFPIRKRRCLVLADSFYVWKQAGTQRIPYRIFIDGQVNVMAGIWDTWEPQPGIIIPSFSIISVPSYGKVENISKRMPLILPTEQWQQYWLSDLDTPEIEKVLDLSFNSKFTIHRIKDDINDLNNNHAGLHMPVDDRPNLFSL